MKRTLLFFAVVGLAAAVAGSWALAQDARPDDRRPARGDRVRPQGPPPGGGPGGMRPPMMGGQRGPVADPFARIPDLTDEQRKQIAVIREKAMEKVRKIQDQMYEDARKLLTPEQAKALDEQRRQITHRGPGGVVLTDEQKRILDDARAEAGKANDPEARRKIMQEATEKVTASFTDEQKKQAELDRPRGGQGGPGARPGGDRRGGLDRPGGRPGGERGERPRRPAPAEE